jgi:hypothetical protein
MTDLSPSSSPLQRAYELIQRDNLTAARDILDDYLVTHPNDADAWWLYAHAVADPVEAQNALQTVLRLQPGYPGASELLDESQALLPITDEDLQEDFARDPRPGSAASTPTSEEFVTSTNPAVRSSSQNPLFLFVAILVAVLLIGLAVILANQANTPYVTPTLTTAATNIAQATVVTTQEVVPAITDAVVSTNDETVEYSAVYAALENFNVIEDSASTEDAAIGQTLLVSVCNDDAQGLRATSINALTALAESSIELETAGNEFIGIRIVDCQRENLVLRTLAISAADAASYASGEINQTDLTSRLVVIS